jgi:hypothetical protein
LSGSSEKPRNEKRKSGKMRERKNVRNVRQGNEKLKSGNSRRRKSAERRKSKLRRKKKPLRRQKRRREIVSGKNKRQSVH